MKKQYIALFLLVLTGGAVQINCQQQAISFEEEDFSDLDRSRGDLPFYKKRAFQAGAAGALGGGALGYTYRNPHNTNITDLAPTLVGAAAGATAGAIKDQGTKYWIRYRINPILRKYTLYTFQNLPRPEAALILAAHRKNLPLMKNLAPRLKRFIARKGVLQALTELYLKQAPNAENLADIQFELFGPINY